MHDSIGHQRPWIGWGGVAVAAAVAVAAVLVAPPAHAVATVLYVGGAGCSNSGPGSPAVPYCSIGAAAAVAVAGQTVQVASGTYSEMVTPKNSGTAGAPIRYTTAPGSSVTVTGGTRGFYVSGRQWISIEGFTVTRTTSSGIYVSNSQNVTLSGDKVSYSGLPIQGYNIYGVYLNNSQSCTVRGLEVFANSASGIYLTNGSTGNLVAGNNVHDNAYGWERNAVGIDLRSSGNSVIGNTTHDNEDSGIQAYPGGNDNLIAGNTTYHSMGFTTVQLANCSHPATGNTAGCQTGDHGIDDYAVTGNRIIGNTVVGNTTAGINVEGIPAGTPSGFVIKNNVSVDNAVNCPDGLGGTTTCPRTKGNLRVDATSGQGIVLDDDLVWLNSPGYLLIWGAAWYRDLASLQRDTGQEPAGRQADPLFVNEAAFDLRTRAGSPAIDAADSAAPGAQDHDILGVPRVDDPATVDRGAGPRTFDDLGAYEYAPTVPFPPVATATGVPGAVALSWTAGGNGGSPVTAFAVYRSTGGGAAVPVLTTDPGTTAWTDTTCPAATACTYRVTARNAVGESPSSTPVSATPQAVPPPTAPAAPVASAAYQAGAAAVSWTTPANGGSPITRYTVYRSDVGPAVAVAALDPTVHAWTDTQLAPGVTYTYAVTASNTVGESAWSAPASVTVPAPTGTPSPSDTPSSSTTPSSTSTAAGGAR